MQLSGRHCYLLLIFFASFLVHTGTAQQLRYAFKNYTPNDGLPSSEVHKVLQDAKHYMWFATDHGVCRYNGYEFKTYNLADNSILGLYEDYKKRIWAWSFSGRLFVFENEKFEEYKWSEKVVNAIRPGVINALYLDTVGSLYVSASGPHSYRISDDGKLEDLISVDNKSTFVFFETPSPILFGYIQSYPPGKFNLSGPRTNLLTTLFFKLKRSTIRVDVPNFLLPERFRAIKVLNGDIFFQSNDFLIKVKSNGTYSIKRTGYVVYDMKEIGGRYYFATEKGLIIEDLNGNVIANYFNGIQIVSMAQDYEGGLWFTSTTKAVFYLNSSKISHLAKANVIVDKKITVLYPLVDSSILAGTNEDYMIRFKPSATWQEIKMFMKPIYSFYQDESSRIFVGGPFIDSVHWTKMKTVERGGLQIVRVPGMTNFERKGDDLFIGLSDNIIKVDLLNEKLSLSAKESFRASKIFVDRNNDLLVGNIFGLWKYIDGMLVKYDASKPILETRITDIAEVKDQFLYLGTRGKGLILLSPDTLREINEENGLISNNVRKIFTDDRIIWVATNKGISVLKIVSTKPLLYTIQNINVQDGLLSNEVNDIVKSNDNIIVATNSGLSYLSRSYFVEKKQASLAFYVTGVKLNGVDVNTSVLKKLGFKQRNILITYEALKYNNPGKINYRYRLNGYDSTWFYTNGLQVQFNPMPYGRYELEIQAKSELDDWNNLASAVSLPIICEAPFWSTAWFWSVAFALIIFFLVVGFRRRIKLIRQRQREEEEVQQRINESEQLALKSQMNPHFIFNSLNSIQQYVIDRDVKGANSFISGFSKLMRQTLDFSSKEKVALTEEIGYLQNYLELERIRMESKFDFTIIIDTISPVADLRVPPLLLQPYVENALRHGVRYLKDESGHIALSFIEKEGILDCIIEDNGIGREKAGKLKAVNPIEYQSKGMSLTAERVELLNRNAERKILISIQDLTDANGAACGTRVSVKFPV